MPFFLKFRMFFSGLMLLMFIGFFSTAMALTTQDQARLAADNFLDFIGSSKTIVAVQPVTGNLLDSSLPAIVAGWVMDLNEGGYILIASSTAFSPVKAYSLSSDYENLPLPYKKFLEQELELYARIEKDTLAGSRTSLSLSQPTPAQDAWAFLLNYDPGDRSQLAYTPGDNLLSTTWNQGYPYNKFLPKIGDQNAVAGCVNTAVAQVMKYHGHPDKGAGTTSYTWNTQTLETVLDHPYYWASMPDAPGMATATHIQDEVAMLFRDLAIVNKTEFNLDNSFAYFQQDDFVRFFGYSNTIANMDTTNTNDDIFFEKMKKQIDEELPVLMTFPGHMVVVDGYATNFTGRNFHVNMGWGGIHDNYYYLDQVVSLENPTIVFQPNLSMIYNVKPCTGADCVSVTPPATDIAPVFYNQFSDIIIPSDVSKPYNIRLDVRDENGDAITFSTLLSNSETITANIVNDVLTITPVAGSLNKAATLQVTASAGGQKVQADFLVITAGQNVTYGKEQAINGLFESQKDINEYPVILEGNTTITGSRGYASQSFFISVKDSQGAVVIADTMYPDKDGFGVFVPAGPHDFPFARYTLSVSLESGVWAYPYTPSYDEYVIKVDSPDANASIQQIATLLGIDMSKIVLSPPGDINNDGVVNLADKIIALKIISLQDPIKASPGYDTRDDANKDGHIGLEEALFW